MPTHYIGAVSEVLALDTFIELIRAIESVGDRLARRNITGGLTHSQFRVVESLYLLGPMQHGEVCAKPSRSVGDITLRMDNLKKRGLVQRERSSEDRRVVLVSPTKTGTTLIEQIFPGHVAAIVEEMDALAAEEQQILGCLCRKLGKRES